MPVGQQPWRLEKFEERYEAWAERDKADDELRLVVVNWLMNRHDDPFLGMARQDGFDDLWFGWIPGSGDGRGNMVACSFRADRTRGVIECNDITTLSYP